MGGRGLAATMVFGLLAGACASGGGILVPSSQPAGPAFTETVIQSGLIVPWEVAVAGDGRMFVTERPGTISVFESTAAMAKRTASAQVSGVRAMGEAGLLGLALDPDFSRNQLFYVCASRLDQGEWRNQVLRYRAHEKLMRAFLDEQFAAPVANTSKGSDWPDLAFPLDDQSQQCPSTLSASDLAICNRDNFSVYPLQKQFFQPTTGTCFVVDAGDQTQDEIDEVSAGANFGWPTVLGPAAGSNRGFADPAWSSGTSSLGVAGADFLSGPGWGTWTGSLIVATLKEQDLRRFSIAETHATEHEIFLDQKYGRLRAVTSTPDGSLLVTTSSGSGDRIVKITPSR